MKAIVQNKYGSPDAFELKEIDKPVIKKDDDVLVRVHATALHAGDYFIMRGAPYLVRLVAGWPNPRDYVPGYDVAGHVEAIGKKVTQFQPGDEVFGECNGTCAEYVCAAENQFALKPANLTLEQAAAVPMSALTALHGLRDAGKVQPGHKVLINGASGGVGTFAVQIAKTFGAKVTGVCSTRNVEMVRSIGADHVIDYTEEDFTLSKQRYDLILDNVANHSFSDCRRVLSPQGTYIPNSGNGGLGYILKNAPVVRIRAAEGTPVSFYSEDRGPGCPEGAHRSRQGHTGHRQNISASCDLRGLSVSERRSRAGKSSHSCRTKWRNLTSN